MAFIAGAEPILRFRQPLIMSACIYVYTYTLAYISQAYYIPHASYNMNWKPYVHGFQYNQSMGYKL